ncbi:RyR domain-containing protein [Mycobacterium sp.]|uniref:RyR domain-containing protein n=1 Tax=Mycobacterium sp. TaxID=1785 RepID=UPI002D426AF8|nr:RyR domain-containing protein [Mycobacterium sp.]HZA10545.1 RyR domain-containing protein [Mycobacterium sp.]
MRRRDAGAVRVLRATLLGFVAVTTAYLAVLAVHPSIRDGLPAWLRWFGRPASWQTMVIIAAAIIALCVISYRSGTTQGIGSVSLTVVLSLTIMNCILGMASFWNCHDTTHPVFVTPLMYTAQLVKGSTSQVQLNGAICPNPPPVALDVARLSSLGVIFVGVTSVAVAMFHAQVDRLRARTARSVTVVVGVDDDSRSMVKAVADTLEPNCQLVLVTEDPGNPNATESRREGARVLGANLDGPEAVEALPVWHKLARLYLLDADAATNLRRLELIGQRSSELGVDRRIPLIVRIDDPWHAAGWRAAQFGGSDARWAADAVGKYEVTARRLLDEITELGAARILICGTSPLTLALCADLDQRRRERNFHADGAGGAVPAITLVGDAAEEYRRDHLHRQKRLGLPSGDESIDAINETPSMSVLTRLIDAYDVTDAGATAVILVDADPLFGARIDPTIGTRLAMRFPDLVIFAWNASGAPTSNARSIFGQLRTYRLTMDLPSGQAHDAWERAAMLIHERYRSAVGGTSPARLPWAELDEFYRGSNRRQVRNALWIVEQIGGHTWNGLDAGVAATPPQSTPAEPLQRLQAMGFDRSSALAMARAEHEDWCRYYKKAGWKHGKVRDEQAKTHPNLTNWRVIEADPALLNAALTSLAETLSQLRELGYRSVPAWRRYRRVGTVTAEQRPQPWTWTTETGHEMQAEPGDWVVEDPGGHRWSVRDDIFRATHEHVNGSLWRRKGFVLARSARPGERIDTLEGPTTAPEGGWVVKGDQGEQWPVSAEEFARRYQGPVE